MNSTARPKSKNINIVVPAGQGKRLKAKHKTITDTAASLDFLKALFEHTERDIYVGTFANKDDVGKTHGERKVISRDEEKITGFVEKYDKPMRAIYFCVGTISAEGSKNGTRNKDTIAELPFLHVDIDFKDLDGETADGVLRKIRALEFPPSRIVATGHGFHYSLVPDRGLRTADRRYPAGYRRAVRDGAETAL
jgi:hypothetical protein